MAVLFFVIYYLNKKYLKNQLTANLVKPLRIMNANSKLNFCRNNAPAHRHIIVLPVRDATIMQNTKK